jgi:hypothetical protein
MLRTCIWNYGCDGYLAICCCRPLQPITPPFFDPDVSYITTSLFSLDCTVYVMVEWDARMKLFCLVLCHVCPTVSLHIIRVLSYSIFSVRCICHNKDMRGTHPNTNGRSIKRTHLSSGLETPCPDFVGLLCT